MIETLVVGAGVAGLTAGAHLARAGPVVVLEREAHPGYHASGRSAALYEPNYGAPTVKALSRASEAFLRDGGYLSPRGLMLLCRAGEDAGFEADMAALGVEEIPLDEAAMRVPIIDRNEVTRAAHQTAAEDIDTDRLLQDLAATIRQAGGKVVTGQPVSEIRRVAAGWEVTAGTETFSARRLVNAAGPWADEIATLAGLRPVGLTPYRRSVARIAAPDGHDVSGWPIFFGIGETWYAKPDAGCLIVSPAEEDPLTPMDAWPEDIVLAEGLARYQSHVTAEVTRPLASWAGLRTFAPDRTLVLGPDPDSPDFVWSAGQGGYGFQTSAAAGALVAATALGESPALSPDVVAALSPARLRERAPA